MATKDEGSSGGHAELPIGPAAEMGPPLAGPDRPDGSAEDIRQLADWISGTLGSTMTRVAVALTAARVAATTGWTDDAGSAFVERLGTVADRAVQLRSDLDLEAHELQRTAEKLGSAQAAIDTAREIVIEHELMARGGMLMTAATEALHRRLAYQEQNDGASAEVLDSIDQDSATKAPWYERAEKLVSDARDQVADEASLLKQLVVALTEHGKTGFATADFCTALAERSLDKAHGSFAGQAESWRIDAEREAYWADEFGKHPSLHGLQEQAARNLAQFRRNTEILSGAADVQGLLGRCAKAGGIAFGIIGIGYSIAEGKPWPKAVFPGVAALGVSLLVGGPIGVGLGLISEYAVEKLMEFIPGPTYLDVRWCADVE